MWLLPVPMVATTNAADVPPETARFFYSGDGWIDLFGKNSGISFRGRYRLTRAGYDRSALEVICRIFDTHYDSNRLKISLRLVEFLDFLEDRIAPGARITISSGYRHPVQNNTLRNRGALAAKASMHQYGMAADLKMEGVPAKNIWDFVKALGFGGTGYYQGETVHVDVGPARSWDEKTSGVGTDISSYNKLIGLVTNYDIYLPGEALNLRFIRMTAFPIGVSPKFLLEGLKDPDKAVTVFRPVFEKKTQSCCPEFNDIEQMANIRWHLPRNLAPGSYRVRAQFCNRLWSPMPDHVYTPQFNVIRNK